jgi:hypothetical protein
MLIGSCRDHAGRQSWRACAERFLAYLVPLMGPRVCEAALAD